MDIFNFDPNSNEFIGKATADKNPLDDDGWLIPAHATKIPPPKTAEGEVAVFKDGGWVILPDCRGIVYWLADGSHHVITKIGDIPPKNSKSEKPQPSAEKRAAARKLEVSDECQRRIFEVANGTTQSNLNMVQGQIAAKAPNARTPQEKEILKAIGTALEWVSEMRSAYARIAADLTLDPSADEHWPECPNEVQSIADKF